MFGRVKKLAKRVLSAIQLSPVRVPVTVPVLQSELLKDRVALITGGGSGIGYSIAEAFLCSGAKVVISGRDERKLQMAVIRLSKIGSASFFLLDNTRPDTFQNALDGIESFDILVNNAGYVGGGSFGNTFENEYDRVLDTNLKGAYFLSQEVSTRWITQGIRGNILNVCSASSLRPGDSPYILSKWGLRSLTVGMARQLVKHGIVVNGIAPGCTNTDCFCKDGDITNMKNPSMRMVTTTEVANLSVVMVSSLARMVVGDILYVTGGGGITTLDD